MRNVKEHLSIDESMIRFKGRSTLKQYNPMKPIERGYKLWCLADDNGYIYKFILYTGKDESSYNEKTRKEFGLGGDVVLSLLSVIKNKNHKVYMDNYFSSLPLMEKLKTKKILACRTIRSNRKDMPQLKDDKSLKRGQFDYRSTPSGITVYKWKDSKSVHLVSNYHGIDITSVQRRQKDGTKKNVSCPVVVKDYNQYMGGVDKHDMLRQLYGTDRKNVKWWHRIFFGVLFMVLVNSYIIFSEENKESPMTLYSFYREVGRGLLTYAERTRPGPLKRR
ncbi:PiggyBac transposable element-derived protein [Trinorchestia longiramus]|nr:PiggyBac transposable element-derived protein [Trinorchestia longiramus]